MKNKFTIISKGVFLIFCCCITTKAEAVCQAETCGQHPSQTPSCGDGDCTPFINPLYPNYPPENHGNCPQDCSVTATCGDGIISAWETHQNCPQDVPANASCGDQICSSSIGETCLTCSQDCGTCGVCGDHVCDCAPNGTETAANCPQDCIAVTTTSTTTSTSTTTTSTTTTTLPCGNGVCAGAETVANCPQDCHCPAGQVFEAGACRTPCPAATPVRLADGTCILVCPVGQINASGICCASNRPYNVNGACSACPAGVVERGGAKAGQCCPANIPRAINDPAECCPSWSPYVFPDGNGGLVCRACPAGQVERGGAKAGQCCPTNIPRALNNPAECCPSNIPYVHPDGNGGLVCTASICEAGQVERGGSKVGQCCPAGIPRAVNDPAECCPSNIPYVHPDGNGGLVCTASPCPVGQVYEAGACRVPCPAATPFRFADGTCHECNAPNRGKTSASTAADGCCDFGPNYNYVSSVTGQLVGSFRNFNCPAYTVSCGPDQQQVCLKFNSQYDNGNCRLNLDDDGVLRTYASVYANDINGNPVGLSYACAYAVNFISNTVCACFRLTGCFDPNTQISLLNGTTKRAGDISVEDILLNPITGNGYQVLSVIESREQSALIEFGYAAVKLKVSEGHAVYLEGGKLKKAKDLVVGDKVLGADNTYHALDFVNSLQVEAGQRVINFNLETDSKDTKDHILLSDGIATGDLFVQGVIKDQK